MLDQFGMASCNPVKIPMEQKLHLHKDADGEPIDATEYRCIIGCLHYLLHTRPDLSFAIGVASRFCHPSSESCKAHLEVSQGDGALLASVS